MAKANDKNNEDVNYFAQTNFRSERRSFGIKRADRTKHMYIIGKTGMGKSTVEENMAIQDIQKGEGVGVVDPHGQFAEKMLSFVPKNRIKDVIYFCPHDTDWPMAFNVMEDVGIEQRHLVASGLIGVFKKIWPDVWSARMEYILSNAILALLEYPDSTILGINRMLSDKDYRKEVVSKITDPVVRAFWEQEFAKYTDRFMTEAGAAIQNKVGQFISNPLIRNIIGQPKSSFDMRKIMDERKILIMNLSKGRIGESNSQLIGAMLITKLYLSAMSRVDIPEKDREDFYLYVDEFQNFATESFKDILSEARKYKLNLILAHQYIAQMDEKVRDAVFGNVGTMVVFRIGAYDAEVLEQEFSPELTAQDIVNLGFANVYLKLMINGIASRPFSAMTLPPIPYPEKSYIDEITEFSRKTYANPKEDVERKISEWHAPVVKSMAEDWAKSDAAKRTDRPPQAVNVNLYDAICSACGKPTQVPFQPDGKRPIYCKDCKEKYLTKDGQVSKVFPKTPEVNPPPLRENFSPPSNIAPIRPVSQQGKPAFTPRFRPASPPASPVGRAGRLVSPPASLRGAPSFDEGEIVEKKTGIREISLEQLKKPTINKKLKAGPDLGGLRQALGEALEMNKESSGSAEKEQESAKKEAIKTESNAGTLNPGDSIKF